jgi:hypothetical protein
VTLLLLVILLPVVFSLVAAWIILRVAILMLRVAFAPARFLMLRR